MFYSSVTQLSIRNTDTYTQAWSVIMAITSITHLPTLFLSSGQYPTQTSIGTYGRRAYAVAERGDDLKGSSRKETIDDSSIHLYGVGLPGAYMASAGIRPREDAFLKNPTFGPALKILSPTTKVPELVSSLDPLFPDPKKLRKVQEQKEALKDFAKSHPDFNPQFAYEAYNHFGHIRYYSFVKALSIVGVQTPQERKDIFDKINSEFLDYQIDDLMQLSLTDLVTELREIIVLLIHK